MKLNDSNLKRLRRRILGVLVLALAAIYALVRALDLDVGELLDYLAASVLLVGAAALLALTVVALVKLLRH